MKNLIRAFNSCKAWAVLLILFLIVFTSVETINANTFTPDNPEHENINVIDFPLVINKNMSSTVVMQVIDNTFYKWREYEIGEDGAICIYLEKPEEKPLKADEAKNLLVASQQWMQEKEPAILEAQTILDPEDLPTFKGMPTGRTINRPDDYEGIVSEEPDIAVSKPDHLANKTYQPQIDTHLFSIAEVDIQYVNNPDERERVPYSACISYPWNTIGFLGSFFPHSTGRGTAFLVGPHTALTNAHNLYNSNVGGWFDYLMFAPGQYQSYQGASISQPYGFRYSGYGEIPQGYVENEGDTWLTNPHDYGAFYIETPLAGITTFMPIAFDVTPSYINLAGYPAVVQGETDSSAMWHSFGWVYRVFSRELDYLASVSGGNSGSPIWDYNPTTGASRIVGIVAASTALYNTGPRFTYHNKELIEEWLQWVPAVTTYTLSFNSAPPAGGTTTDLTNAGPYEAGATVSIRAVPSSGYSFSHWSAPAGSFANANAQQTTFTMPAQNTTITANFNAIATPAPTLVSPANGSTVAGTGNRITFQWNPSSGATHYNIQAYRVVNDLEIINELIGNQTNYTSEAVFTNNGDSYHWGVAAWSEAGGWSDWSEVWYFTNSAVTYNLALTANPSTGGTVIDVTGTGPYEANAVVNIRAVPNAGYSFSHWSAPAGSFASQNSAETTFTMPGENVTLVAIFESDADAPIALPDQLDVEIDQMWRINFNREYNVGEISNIYIDEVMLFSILTDGAENFVNAEVEWLPSDKQAIIKPSEDYLPGETYHLIIVLSNSKHYRMKFTVAAN